MQTNHTTLIKRRGAVSWQVECMFNRDIVNILEQKHNQRQYKDLKISLPGIDSTRWNACECFLDVGAANEGEESICTKNKKG